MKKYETKLLERNSIEYKGVTISYEIDYRNEKISIVNPDGSTKQFLFKNRTLDYMGGWISILEGINIALDEAEDKLMKYLDERKKEYVGNLF